MKIFRTLDLALLVFLACVTAHAASNKPNVILMMCDDLGWGDVGFNGNKTIKTPHLDQMAANGLKFTRFYAASAVCSPTRGSVVTGRHPYRLGIPGANSGHMRPEEHTLPELLGKLGYATGHFGKWHLGTLTKTVKESNRGGPGGVAHFSPPWQNGFQRCFSTEAKTPTYDPMWKPKKGASGKGWNYVKDLKNATPYGTHYWNEKSEMVKDNLRGDDSRVIMDRAIPFIEEAVKAKKPFFTIVWFHTPHLPVVAGPKHAALYAKHPTYAKNYYGCVTAMDEQVGRLRAKLRELKVADNTMVWFCSDNGPEGQAGSAPGSAGPFRGRKRSLHEGGIRVPGLLEWPALVKPGISTDFPAVTSDYLPTILNVLGIEYPDQRPIDGISLLPVLKSELKERDKPIGFAYGGKAALTGQRYKIVRVGAGRAKPKGKKKNSPAKDQLFDLLKDPGETKDLAVKHPEILKQMAQQLDQWLASCAQSNQGIDYPKK